MTRRHLWHTCVAVGLGVTGLLVGWAAQTATVAVAAFPSVPPSCAPAAARVFTSSGAVAIPDGGTVRAPISVSGLGRRQIIDVDVRTNIRHPISNELNIRLKPPVGIESQLVSNRGDIADDLFNGTLWDNQANPGGTLPYDTNPGLVTDHPFGTGPVTTLTPEKALRNFGDGDGVWTLIVSDSFGNGVTGSIDSWSIEIATSESSFLFGGENVSTTSSTPVEVGASTPNVVTSKLTATATRGSYLSALAVRTNISHTRSSDLDITLTSPNGTTVTLTTDSSGTAQADVFAGTTWSDGSLHSPARQSLDVAPAPDLRPEEPLTAFTGEDPNGVWTLTISDDTAGEGGRLNSWGMSLTAFPCKPGIGLAVTPSTQAARVGRQMSLDIAATVGPHVPAKDLAIHTDIPAQNKFVRLAPSAGGACEAPSLGKSGRVRCTWAGSTAVGTVRSVRITVVPFVAGYSRWATDVGNAHPEPVENQLNVLVGASATRAANGKRCTILGTRGPDTIRAAAYTSGKNVICGLGGRDRIVGGGLADVIDGGPGDDVISGDWGNDVIFGGLGRDNISGSRGDDILIGGPGADSLRGGTGRDTAVRPAGDTLLSVESRR